MSTSDTRGASQMKFERRTLLDMSTRKTIITPRRSQRWLDRSEDRSGPGQGTSAEYEITDRHCV